LALSRYGRHADECSLSGADSRFNGLTITGCSGCQLANPLVKITRNAAADMVHFAGEFGLTPRARSWLTAAGRVTGPGKFDGLLA
jgi:phage terminase small subunit